MFVKKGVVIDKGGAGEVDDDHPNYAVVIKSNNKIYCYYTAYDGSEDRIALAISEDGVNFVKKGVVIPLGGAGEIDTTHSYAAGMMRHNDKIYGYYTANDERVALAISEDGM